MQAVRQGKAADQAKLIANIRAEMARHRTTQGDIAATLGITRQAVSQRLLGRVPFRDHELTKIAILFELTVSKLVGT